jgi:hypothetical protein
MIAYPIKADSFTEVLENKYAKESKHWIKFINGRLWFPNWFQMNGIWYWDDPEYVRYPKYLLSGYYLDKRNFVIRRDNHQCVWCRSTENLEVHHLTYRFVATDYEEVLMITLCHDCHRYEHRFEVTYNQDLEAFIYQDRIGEIYEAQEIRRRYFKGVPDIDQIVFGG